MRIRRRLALYGTGVAAAGMGVFVLVLSSLIAGGVGTDQDTVLAALADRTTAAIEAAPDVGPALGRPLVVDDLSVSDDPFILVVDEAGRERYASSTIDGQPIRAPAAVVVEAIDAGRSIATVRVGAVETRVAARAWEAGGQRGVVIAGQPTRVLTRQLAGLRIFLFVAFIVTLIAVAIVSWLVTGRALRPLVALAATADEIGTTGDLTRRLPPVGSRDEVGALTASFNAMLDRLAGAQARLAEALEAQRRFVADASHDLRTPLSTVRTSAEFMRERPDASPEDRAEALDDIVAEAARMSSLVEDLLLLARSDAGVPETRVPVDLAAVAMEAARRQRRADRAIRVDVPGAVVVRGDPDALARVVANLVDNALRHGAGDVEVGVRLEGERAVLEVGDRGPGIPEGMEDRLFERFRRLDQARSGAGAGLGLAIARSIVEAHGGTIRASQRDGGGALVRVELPAG